MPFDWSEYLKLADELAKRQFLPFPGAEGRHFIVPIRFFDRAGGK
jgi:hypothetical protein